MKRAVVATFLLIACMKLASAQQAAAPQMQMGGMDMPKGDAGPSSQAFDAAMKKMDQGMNITYTGNADRDFVEGMIPHHQGAIDMAKVELQYGKDASLRKLARDIIAAQEREIATMKKWQQQHAN